MTKFDHDRATPNNDNWQRSKQYPHSNHGTWRPCNVGTFLFDFPGFQSKVTCEFVSLSTGLSDLLLNSIIFSWFFGVARPMNSPTFSGYLRKWSRPGMKPLSIQGSTAVTRQGVEEEPMERGQRDRETEQSTGRREAWCWAGAGLVLVVGPACRALVVRF